MQKEKRIALVNYCAVANDPEANISRIIEFLDCAKQEEADLVLFPELSLTGNIPGACDAAISRDDSIWQQLLKATAQLNISASVGFFEKTDTGKNMWLRPSFIMVKCSQSIAKCTVARAAARMENMLS